MVNLANVLIFWLSLVILKTLNVTDLKIYRKLEKVNKKIILVKSHLWFNKTCVLNNLLPKYTHFKLFDREARDEGFVHQCRMNLVTREIDKQTRELQSLNASFADIKEQLRLSINNNLKFDALFSFLNRNSQKLVVTQELKHKKKLNNLYGSKIFIQQEKQW